MIIIKIFLFLLIITTIKGNYSDICPVIVSRKRWGGLAPFEVDYQIIPVKYVIFHHTVTPNCNNEEQCSALMKSIQNYHLEHMEFHDIGYNFVIGGDGQVYEGVGWHKVGAHTYKYNTKSLGIAFTGTFTGELPNGKQLKAAKKFLQCAVELGELDSDYKLFGARQVSAIESPGLRFYREIQKWPHFERNPPKF